MDIICIPTILPDWQVPQEGQGGEGITGAGSPNMEVTTMVSSLLELLIDLPLTLPDNPKLLMDHFGVPHIRWWYRDNYS